MSSALMTNTAAAVSSRRWAFLDTEVTVTCMRSSRLSSRKEWSLGLLAVVAAKAGVVASSRLRVERRNGERRDVMACGVETMNGLVIGKSFDLLNAVTSARRFQAVCG